MDALYFMESNEEKESESHLQPLLRVYIQATRSVFLNVTRCVWSIDVWVRDAMPH